MTKKESFVILPDMTGNHLDVSHGIQHIFAGFVTLVCVTLWWFVESINERILEHRHTVANKWQR